MRKIELIDKKKIFLCKDFTEGHYFDILEVSNLKYFFYTSLGFIKLSIFKNESLIEDGKNIIKCIDNFFKVFYDNRNFYLFIGGHFFIENEKNREIQEFVFNKKSFIADDIKNYRSDHRNGIYILKSINGYDWDYIIKKPVIHRFIKSKFCPLGSCCFDTHPSIIKFNNVYHFYGRLNTKLDERLVFLIRSKDLINWSEPIKVNIKNPECIAMNPNYYLFNIFKLGLKLYSFIPYFEACGTNLRRSINGKTLLVNSNDGINWTILGKCLEHNGRYQHRLCSVLVKKNNITIYIRENVLDSNSNIVSYKIK